MNVVPQRRLRADSGLQARMVLSFAVLAMLYIGFISVLAYLGVGFVPITIIVSLMILAQWYFSDRLVLWSTGARVVTPEQAPRLYSITQRVASRNGIRMPKLAIMNTSMPNAFATGRGQGSSSVVAVTAGLLNLLDDEELEGVIAHELAHIRHRDVLVLTLASLFSTVAWYLMQFGMFGAIGNRDSRNNGSGAWLLILLVAALTWFVSFLVIRAISRYREYAADRGAAQMTGRPGRLASALGKISGAMKRVPEQEAQRVEGMNAFFIIPALSRGTIASLFSTHPPVDERIRRLLEMEKSLGPAA